MQPYPTFHMDSGNQTQINRFVEGLSYWAILLAHNYDSLKVEIKNLNHSAEDFISYSYFRYILYFFIQSQNLIIL